jgi:hypothetical protein
MTNPDERRSRIRVSTPIEGIVPLNYGAALAAQIPQVQMPSDWNAPRQFPLPVVAPPAMAYGVGMVGLGVNVAAAIPQVQLPLGWDAPLANPVPVVPPAPQLQRRRGRGRGRGLGPLHDISGGQADPALNNLHRGHIALRERNADYNSHIQELQQQAAREELLEKIAAERRTTEAVAAREEMLKQLVEQEQQRQAAEAEAARQHDWQLFQHLADQQRLKQAAEAEAARQHNQQLLEQLAEEERRRKAAEAEAAGQYDLQMQQLAEQRHAAETEAARQHDQQLQQVAQQAEERQAAAQQAALAVEPLYHDPPRHIDIEAALQERNQREDEWIRRTYEMWRNEQRADEQMQLDELEEQQHISIEDRNLQQRMMRLKQLANHMSSSQIDQYQAQVTAQAEQIQMDREMAAVLAAEYEEQMEKEMALRREMECDEDEDEDEDDYPEEYDNFGRRVSPLQFPSSSPPPSPTQSPLQFPSSSPAFPMQPALPSPTHSPSPLPPAPLPPLRFPSPDIHPLQPPAPARPLPPACAPYQEPLHRHSLGPMNVQCCHCNALHFDCEKLSKSTRAEAKFGSCCLQGQI